MSVPAHPAVAVAGDAPAPRLRARRLLGAVAAAPSFAVLCVAAWLEPAGTGGAGLGTHTQIVSLPRCEWMTLMDVPCPTCGMTTAFAHAANANLLASFLTQPLGCLLAIATAMTFLVGTYVAVTGSPVASVIARQWRSRTGWLLAGSVLAAWAYKVASYKLSQGEILS